MKRLKNIITTNSAFVSMSASLFALLAVLTVSTTAYARVAPPTDTGPGGVFEYPTCQEYVLTFPAWYRGITDEWCQVQIDELNDFIKIPLNIIEILIQVVAYAATGFIVWGGFKYMKSQGEPNKISESKMAIIQAIAGLVIALASVAIVRFVQGRIL